MNNISLMIQLLDQLLANFVAVFFAQFILDVHTYKILQERNRTAWCHIFCRQYLETFRYVEQLPEI